MSAHEDPISGPMARLERWAQVLWDRFREAELPIYYSDPTGRHRFERMHLALSDALQQLHGARMVLDGEAGEAAETLYHLVWQRILIHRIHHDTPAQQEAA